MSVFESIDRPPVTYVPTGDRAMLMAWALISHPGGREIFPDSIVAVLCLEDGRAVQAGTDEFTFDYRYDSLGECWVDVSKIPDTGDLDGDSDQEDADDGDQAVP